MPDSTHILLSFERCDPKLLADPDALERIFAETVEEAGLIELERRFAKFPDGPQVKGGVSGIVIITESHLSIHTWPDEEYAAVDVFTCGEAVKAYKAAEILKEKLGGNTVQFNVLRGPGYFQTSYTMYCEEPVKMARAHVERVV